MPHLPGDAMIDKNIVFLRHGCTYMNEYLGRGLSFGAPGFTDVFTGADYDRYRDSPLSAIGQRQAKALAQNRPSFLNDCELVVTSPLRRALQTLEIGIRPHLDEQPIIALPEAAERLYLVSDQGRPVEQLRQEFEFVDFTSGFVNKPVDPWWFHHKEDDTTAECVEWRPAGQGQCYACPGEPPHVFDARMESLYQWLKGRPESSIAVVCHWGVIDWFLDDDFDNCQWRSVSLSDLESRRAA